LNAADRRSLVGYVIAHIGQDGFDYGTTEAALAVVDDRVLTRCDRSLRLLENEACRAIRLRLE
jgi:hypothetical protein